MKINQLLYSGLCVTGALLSCSGQNEAGNNSPNIILIFADDMGYGDVSFFNPNSKIQTPAIDNLAENGLAFTNAHSSGSVCTPSRYGILTGRYAFRNEKAARGLRGFDESVIEPGRKTLASVLSKAGYASACIGKWHLGVDWTTTANSGEALFNEETGHSNVDYFDPLRTGPNDFGFQHSFIHVASTDMPPYMFVRDHSVVDPEVVLTNDIYPSRLENTVYDWDLRQLTEDDVYWRRGVWWRRGEISRSFRLEDCQTTILNEGLSFIEWQTNNNSSSPFFLYLPLTGPHTPWLPVEEFQGKTPIGEYGDFILEIDNIVLQIKNKLKELGNLDNTIIIFTSDNGSAWPQQEIERTGHEANFGRRGQKGDVWDGGHHVPLVISWPAIIKESAVYEHLVSLTDFFATFADLTGQEMDADSGEDSYSLLHVLQGDLEQPVRDHMIHHSSRRLFGIRKEGWKYIDGLGSGGFTSPGIIQPTAGGPNGQLYNIETDPFESNNLYMQNPQMLEYLKNELQLLIDAGRSH
jgi:arylsulfatase A